MSNEANPPNAPLGSQIRRDYWTTYWNQWGSKDESKREYAGVIAEIQHDIALQQLQIEKYHGYKARGFSWADTAIQGTQNTINTLQKALVEKQIEFKKKFP